MLTQFFLTQLQAQLAGLQALLATSITRKAALLKEEKARRRMAASRAHRCIAVQDPCSTSQAALLPTSEKDEKDTSVEVETESARDEGRAPAGSVGTAPSGTAEHMGKQRRRTIRKQVERLEKLIRTISTAQNADQGEISVENTQADLVDETVDISCNPKTRGGWGFWKT